MTPRGVRKHGTNENWNGERITWVSYLRAEVANAPSTWRGKKEGSSVKQDSKICVRDKNTQYRHCVTEWDVWR